MTSRTNAPALSAEIAETLDEAAQACRILELNGHGDKIFGHIAMRDPDGRGFWMKRHMISLGEVWDHRDFLLLSFDGEVLAGQGKSHSEWPIHGEILLAREDISFTAHTHPFNAVIYSAITEPLRAIKATQVGAPPRYEGSSELINRREEGRDLAEALGEARAVFMRNHGVAFCGANAIDLVLTGIELEHTCAQVLAANGSGYDWSWLEAKETQRKASDVKSKGRGRPLYDYYCREVARATAAGDARLSRGSLHETAAGA